MRGRVVALWVVLLAGAAAAQQRGPMLTPEESRPWIGVGRVNVATQSKLGLCTGTLIAPDLVLTAAHCLINRADGKPHAPGNVHFVAGWRGGRMVAARKAAALVIPPGYDWQAPEGQAIPWDVALIRLETPIPEAQVTPFRPQAEPIALDAATPLTLISYRRDRPHALTRQDGCVLGAASATVLSLGCDVTFGVSGAPVFVMTDQGARVIAVIAAMAKDPARPTAYAVRLDAALPVLLAQLR